MNRSTQQQEIHRTETEPRSLKHYQELVASQGRDLLESEQKYERVLEILQNQCIFFSHSADGRFTFISPSVTNLLGYTQEEFLVDYKKTLSDHPVNVEAMKKTDLSLMGIRQPPYDMEAIHKDGAFRRFVVTEIPVLDRDGRVVKVEGISRDVTEKRAIEEKLKHHQEHLEQVVAERTVALENSQRMLTRLLNQLPCMAYKIQTRAPHTIDFLSDGCANLTGYGASYFTRNPSDLLDRMIHPEDRARVKRAMGIAIEHGQSYQLEYRIIGSDGTAKWVLDQGEGLYNLACQDIARKGFIFDFTAYKKREQNLLAMNNRLKALNRTRCQFDNLIGHSPVMQRVYDLIEKAAISDDYVMISGESGTGKELAAEAIHRASPRHRGHFVPVNCSAIPESLIESEFFGYKKNAFTGASRDKKGFLDMADGGTLFLDEIGDISLPLQVKLLRAIDGGGYTPLGCTEVKKPDIRIIAASNRDLREMVAEGRMRSDFYYRVHVIPITLPPLRDRGDDILLLSDHFLKALKEQEGVSVLTPKEVVLLKSHPWPGNIRELQNALRRYQSLKSLDFLAPEPPPRDPHRQPSEKKTDRRPTLRETLLRCEKEAILTALEQNRWQKNLTAQELGISRKTLFRKMKDCGIS